MAKRHKSRWTFWTLCWGHDEDNLYDNPWFGDGWSKVREKLGNNIWRWKSCLRDGCRDCSQRNKTRDVFQGRCTAVSAEFLRLSSSSVIVDEPWWHYYKSETKAQSKQCVASGEPFLETTEVVPSIGKVIMTHIRNRYWTAWRPTSKENNHDCQKKPLMHHNNAPGHSFIVVVANYMKWFQVPFI